MNAMIGRILPITAIIVPFWLVRAMVPWKETFEVLPAILVVGISFASMQFFWSNNMDSNLVDITAGLFSLLAPSCSCSSGSRRRYGALKKILWRHRQERVFPAFLAARPGRKSIPIQPAGHSRHGCRF